MIGFGSYHYKYANGHECDTPIIAFSLHKPAFSLYVFTPTQYTDSLLEGLGKFRMSKTCIYVKNFLTLTFQLLKNFVRLQSNILVSIMNVHEDRNDQ